MNNSLANERIRKRPNLLSAILMDMISDSGECLCAVKSIEAAPHRAKSPGRSKQILTTGRGLVDARGCA